MPKCPECGRDDELVLWTYGLKCTKCYDWLLARQNENDGVMTLQILNEFKQYVVEVRRKK